MEHQAQADEISFPKDNWYESELSSANIGDKRLNKRLVKIASDLSSNITAPINQASGDWNSTKAAYSFFDNDKVSPDNILRPHLGNTAARMANHKVVLAIQDTTTINYASHEAVELGHIGKEGTSGLMQHNTLAVTPSGLPLGLIDQTCWSRPLTPEEKAIQDPSTIEEKESFKWIEALRNTQLHSPANTKVVTVCDREADIYEFFDEAETLNASVLVRLKHDRQIEESSSGIKSYLKSQDIVAQYKITVPKKKGEYEERTATVVLRHTPVTINAPENIEDDVTHMQIKMHAIYVEEINVPKGATPVHWYLLTNLSISSVSEAIEKVEWYKARWMVEIFHKTEKSCCSIEDCRLETAERLMNFLALKSIIAWRVLFMTYINRQEPKAPAQLILSPTEITVLENVISKKSKTKIKKIKTVRQAVSTVASLGGHLNRKTDKNPGIITVCRGIQRLHDFTDGFVAAKLSIVESKSKTYG
jgi:hypothetical protein